jgi:methionyl aminopeptidase
MASRPSLPSILSGLRRPRVTAGGVERADAPPVIKLKTPREIDMMREAGRVVAKALDQVRRMAVPGTCTAEMDEAVA